jgi:hypothetical protein
MNFVDFWIVIIIILCGFSPRANYADRATVTAKLAPNLWIEGCRVVSAADPLRS